MEEINVVIVDTINTFLKGVVYENNFSKSIKTKKRYI